MILEKIKRAWARLAPKLIAFLATGLTTTGLIAVAQLFGITIAPELAVLLVGGISSLAAYIQRDRLLTLPPSQFSVKVLAFVLTSATGATVVALLQQFGVDVSPYAPQITLVLTIVATIVGYLQSDHVVVDAGSGKVGAPVGFVN